MERILLAAPRGYCAGVAYAIEVVDLALRIHGSPLYVRHAIVHNEWVVQSFEKRGVVFVESIEEIPCGSVVVFSAHGVSPEVRRQAEARSLHVIDATCPLVTKVHNEARHYAAKGYFMIFIGHQGHVEAEGTMGEAPGRMVLVETPADAEALELPKAEGAYTHPILPHPLPPLSAVPRGEGVSGTPPPAPSPFAGTNHPESGEGGSGNREGIPEKLAVLTQTTLSVEEVKATLAVLKRRFPHLETPRKEDICYATTNRQSAIRQLAAQCDLVLIVGSKTSSNSNRLREVAESLGVEAHLVMSPDEIRPEWRSAHRTIGLSSGASTPEHLVEDIIGGLLAGRTDVPVEVLETVREQVNFKPPRDLIQLALAH